jgi:hypothetical protein
VLRPDQEVVVDDTVVAGGVAGRYDPLVPDVWRLAGHLEADLLVQLPS